MKEFKYNTSNDLSLNSSCNVSAIVDVYTWVI